MEIGGDAYALVNFRTTENNLTYIYYGEPVAAEDSPVVEVGGNKGYFTVDGGKLCFVVVKATENIVETDLTIGDMAMVVLTATLASVGTAGVSGAGMIMLAMVLTSIGIPVEGIAIIAGVDKIFDMGRTALNITGDATCALWISKLERAKKASKAAAK